MKIETSAAPDAITQWHKAVFILMTIDKSIILFCLMPYFSTGLFPHFYIFYTQS